MSQTIEEVFQEFVNERFIQKYPTQILEEISCADALAFAKKWAEKQKVPWGKIDPKHVIKACTCNKDRCPICDWGLAICALCGAAEAELVNPCVPKAS